MVEPRRPAATWRRRGTRRRRRGKGRDAREVRGAGWDPGGSERRVDTEALDAEFQNSRVVNIALLRAVDKFRTRATRATNNII